MALTYPTYLGLPQLLALQVPRSEPAEHDEMLFIVIHQVYELWFKLLLHESDALCRQLGRGDLFPAIATLKRCRTVMKTLVGQLDILETMTPLSFASFRNRLDTASGFQSTQFRELEFLYGYKRPETLPRADAPEDPLHRAVRARYEAPTVVDGLYRCLVQVGVPVPVALLDRDVRQAVEDNEALQEALLAAYRTRPELVMLFESMLDFDEGFMEWRYRHVKLVERTIGAKKGTGGSAGVAFLKETIFRPLFPDLWAVRHRM